MSNTIPPCERSTVPTEAGKRLVPDGPRFSDIQFSQADLDDSVEVPPDVVAKVAAEMERQIEMLLYESIGVTREDLAARSFIVTDSKDRMFIVTTKGS